MKNNLGSPEPTATSAPKRRHRIREILLGFLVLVALVMITPAVLSLFLRDIPPVSAPDLALTKVSVSVADNAYFDMVKMDNAGVDIPTVTDQLGFINGVLAGVRWDQAVVDDALTKNAEALRYLADAAHKPSFQEPSYADPAALDVTYFPKVPNWWSVFRTAVLNAVNLQKQGKEQEAFQQAVDMIRVGRNIERSQGPLIVYLIGANLKMLGLETVQRLLTETKLTAEQLTPFIAQIENFSGDLTDVANALKMEHALRMGDINEAVQRRSSNMVDDIMTSSQLMLPWRLWVPRGYYFQPNKFAAAWSRSNREMLTVSATPCAQTAQQTVTLPSRSTNNFTLWIRMYFAPNAIGRLYDEIGFFDYSNVRLRHCDEETLLHATQTLIALKAYQQTTGALPTTLAELVPAYLPSVPVDSYDGTAIKYSATKKVVYSVGNNRTDTGGSTGDDWRKMDDPAFTVR